jgi:hypothetical protein
MVGAIAGMAGGLISAGFNIASSIKQKKLARQAAAKADEYNRRSLQFANNTLGQAKSGQAEARNLYQARMANAGAIERDIYQNQANTIASLGKNATDASQMLSLAGAVQGNTNQAFGQLQQVENEDKQRRYGNVQYADQNVQGALGNMVNVYGGQAAQAQQSANQLMAAGQQNLQNGIDTIGSTAMAAGMGEFGDFGGGSQGSKTYNGTPVHNSNPFRPAIGGAGFSSGINPPAMNLSLPFKIR